MPDGSDPIAVQVLESVTDVAAADWDACAGAENPFVSHAFLAALEESGSASRESGWLPRHLVLRDAGGRLAGAVPLYLKSHSYGEYVFDWSWADAYERAGGRYYPKLQSAVPFTPVTGPRLLVRPDVERKATVAGLIAALAEITREYGVSSLHVTFPTRADWQDLGEAGFLQRTGLQFFWDNAGYADFEDFLGRLTARKRKAIRKERRQVAESGLTLRSLHGPEITPAQWDAFYGFYLSTVDKKWAHAYLTRDFFTRIAATLSERVVLILAEDRGRPVAGALNLRGGNTLYGRNWGAHAEHRFLHFEACYYQAIDYAIRHGLARVEAGAQGEHKVQRGYLPGETYSAHLIADRGLHEAVAQFLARERTMVRHQIAALRAAGPYKAAE